MLLGTQIYRELKAKETHMQNYLRKAINFKSLRSLKRREQKTKDADTLNKLAMVVFSHLTKKC